MKELRDLVDAYEAQPGGTFVLATVVATRGSTYRKPGARMLLDEHSWLSGAISGGCVEADLIRKAWWRTSHGGVSLVRYDGALSRDEDSQHARQGFGLGCDGSVDVLLQHVSPGTTVHPLACLSRALRSQEPWVVSTVVRSSGPLAALGQQLWLGPEGCVASSMATPLEALVRAQAHDLRTTEAAARRGISRASHERVAGVDVRLVHELIVPAPRLFVFGRNYDAIPLASLSDQVGWDVTLVAQREPHRAAPSRLPRSVRLVLGPLLSTLPRLRLDDRSAAVVMTHDYEQDRQLLGALLQLSLGYVGVLGPERRTERMLNELAAQGVPLPPSALARLHAPVGLNLGASSPEEIALSIVAELQAELAGANARMRRATYEPSAMALPSTRREAVSRVGI